MRKSTWITLLAVLLVLALSTGALAAKGISILGFNVAMEDEGEEEGLLGDPLPGSVEEGDGEGELEDDEEEPGGARALYPELEGKEFGQAISALAKTYPGAVADAIRVSRGEEPKGPPPHGDQGEEEYEEEDDEEGELESTSVKSSGKPAFVGKPKKK